MKCTVIGKSVRGASHIASDTTCQDSFKKTKLSDGCSIIAIADGHGSSSCPYSKSGSIMAVNVFVDIMKELHDSYADKLDELSTYLNRDGELKIAQSIDFEWKKQVLAKHSKKNREIPLDKDNKQDEAAIYKMYGTTLLGLLITPNFVFAFQLGDGDIMFANNAQCEHLIEGDKILGVETHSLSKMQAWQSAISSVRRFDGINKPFMFMLSTDGFSNSYVNDAEFKKTCKGYFDLISEHGINPISKQLEDWLSDTSKEGCGDDITLSIAYITD